MGGIPLSDLLARFGVDKRHGYMHDQVAVNVLGDIVKAASLKGVTTIIAVDNSMLMIHAAEKTPASMLVTYATLLAKVVGPCVFVVSCSGPMTPNGF